MPLFEIETDAHIIISWAADEETASAVVHDAYPGEKIVRLTRRPRDCWVISKSALGITDSRSNPCSTARECLAKAAGDKVHAIRLYMHETGDDLAGGGRVRIAKLEIGINVDPPVVVDLDHALSGGAITQRLGQAGTFQIAAVHYDHEVEIRDVR